MAEESDDGGEKPKKAGMSTMTLVGVIVGVVALQAIIVFAVFKFFISSPDKPADKADKGHSQAKKASSHDEPKDEEEEEEETVVRPKRSIVATDDIIINPKGSSSRYIMLALGLEVDTEEQATEVKDKLMIPIRDRAFTIVSSYTVDELQRGTLRDSLKTIIRKDLKPYFGEIKLRNVYFSKFVIQ